MKKRLLTMALAAVFGLGAYAYSVDDYIETNDARLKVTGENIVNNEYNATDYWSNENGGPLAANWKTVVVAGPDGDNVTALQSQSASNDEGSALTASWQLQNGIYAISFWVYSPAAASTSITVGGNNYVSFNSGEEARQINAAVTLAEAQWTQITDTVVVTGENEILQFKATGVQEGVCLTNFEIVSVDEVYDIRIAQRRMAYVQQLLDDPNFNTEAATTQRANVVKMIQAIETRIAGGQLDDETQALSLLDRLNQALVQYMDATSSDLTDESIFKFSTGFENLNSGLNRKDIKHQQVIGGFMFEGNEDQTAGSETNWQHRGIASKTANDNPVLTFAIAGSTQNTGSGALFFYDNTEKMVKGKYFISAEVCNAKLKGNSWDPDYTLERKMISNFNGVTDTVATISGEEYVRIYGIGEYSGTGDFKVGFRWQGTDGPARFDIQKAEIRFFGSKSAITDKALRVSAWNNFKAQWNASTNNRNALLETLADASLPWAKDSLQRAQTKYDVEYNKILNAGWIDADGNDALVADIDTLNNWAKYQGGEHADNEAAATYTVVRGYQYAVNYAKKKNEPFTNLVDAIKAATTAFNDDMNVNGDKTTFQAAISTAQGVYDDKLATTTDDKFEADSIALDEARKALVAAQEAFLKSAELTPIVDIDFSNDFETVDIEGETNYVIKGAQGEMFFGTNANPDRTTPTNQAFTIGHGEGVLDGILRMANNNQAATVTFAEADVPTDNDVLRIKFDYWGGKLNNSKPFLFNLLNAADEKVACIEWTVQSWTFTAVNDFNNAENTGLDWIGKVSWLGEQTLTNDQICVDKNKTSVDLIIDYKAQTLQGSMVNGTNGTSEGQPVAIPEIADNKIVKISFAATGNNDARRSWFDNLLVYKYPSQAAGPVDTGIATLVTKGADNAVYTLSGLRVKSAVKPGLYIVNGRKVVIK